MHLLSRKCDNNISSYFAELCNDQLSILRESHAEREIITCGRNTSLEWEERDLPAPANGEEFDRLQVKFYSSRQCHNCGFFMFAFCINQANTYDRPGCVQNIPTLGKRDTESGAHSMVSPLSVSVVFPLFSIIKLCYISSYYNYFEY